MPTPLTIDGVPYVLTPEGLKGREAFKWASAVTTAIAALQAGGGGGGVGDALIDIRDFGAECDGVTDDTAAIQAAIESVDDPAASGKVFIPFGTTYCASTIHIDRGVVITGVGHAHGDYPGSKLTFPAGVTAIKFHSYGGAIIDYPTSGVGSHRSIVENLTLVALGQDTTTTTATIVMGDGLGGGDQSSIYSITLADGSDFANGQMIRIKGASGVLPKPMHGVFLTCANGSTQAYMTTTPGQVSHFPLLAGDYILTTDASNNPGALSTPTKVASRNVSYGKDESITAGTRSGSTVTMTTSVAHNLNVGDLVYIKSDDPDANYAPGYFTVASLPTSTTFTYTQAGTGSALSIGADGPYSMHPAITLASAATDDGTEEIVSWVPDLYTEIRTGGGTNTITVAQDVAISGGVTNHVVEHADCGIMCRTTMAHVRNVTVHDFQGNGIHIQASVHDDVYANANMWRLSDCQVRRLNSAGGSMNGLYIEGTDGNAGTGIGLELGGGIRGWAMLDFSTLGNTHIGYHCDTYRGYITYEAGGHKSSLVGCYGEGGTYSTLGPGTLVMNGTIGLETGGASVQAVSGAVWANRFSVGNEQENTDYSLDFCGTDTSLFDVYPNETSWPDAESLTLRKVSASDVGGGIGWYSMMSGNTQSGTSFAWSDADDATYRPTAPGNGAGQFWLPHGYYMGGNNNIGNGRRRFLFGGTAAAFEAHAIYSAAADYLPGDIYEIRDPEEAGSAASKYVITGYQCVSDGFANEWVQMRYLTGN